jgi:hypothetical protein
MVSTNSSLHNEWQTKVTNTHNYDDEKQHKTALKNCPHTDTFTAELITDRVQTARGAGSSKQQDLAAGPHINPLPPDRLPHHAHCCATHKVSWLDIYTYRERDQTSPTYSKVLLNRQVRKSPCCANKSMAKSKYYYCSFKHCAQIFSLLCELA